MIMKAIKRLYAIRRLAVAAAIAITGGFAAGAQTFFSINAGTDGFNVNLTNAMPFFAPAIYVAPTPPPPPPPRNHRAVVVPMLPGLEYEVPVVVSPRHVRRAVREYREVVHNSAATVSLPGGITIAIPVGHSRAHYYYDDDDDYDDWMEHQHKRHKKAMKRYKKAMKHHRPHGHHHHHDD